MNTYDPAGARRQRLLDAVGVEVVGLRVYVAKDRGDSLPLQRVGSGNEGERRHDYLALQSQSADDNFKRDGRVAHGYAVSDAGELGNLPLKLLHVGAVVGQPVSVE